MSGSWKYWSVCVATILVIMMAGVSVSGAGSAKIDSPGISNVWRYGGNGEEDAGNIQQTNDGGYILVGCSNSVNGDIVGNHGGSDIWVMKLAQNMTPEWSHCYGGSLNEYDAHIQQTVDGGYILMGATSSVDLGVTNHGDCDLWVVKLNQMGVITNQVCLGGSRDELCYHPGNTIEQTVDGGYILIGNTESIDGDVKYNHDMSGATTDIWVVKLTPNLAIQWQKSIGGSNFDGYEEGFSIEQTSDNGYILTCITDSNDGDVRGNHGNPDVFVVKLNEDGLIQWKRTLGGTMQESAVVTQQTADGGYLLAGYTNSIDGDLTGLDPHYIPTGNADVWIVKLSPLGEIQWQKLLGGSYSEEMVSLKQTPDGGYALLGTTESPDGDVIGHHAWPDMWMIKLNSLGIPQWQRCIGGNGYDLGSSIQTTSDNGYLLYGDTDSTNGDLAGTTDHGGRDFLLVKLYGPLTVNGIAPSRVSTGIATTVVLTGENLVQNGVTPTVTFYKTGTEITLPVAEFQTDGTRITCDITPSTFLSPGVYNVRVTTPDNQYVNLPNAITVTCGPAPTVSSISPTSGIQGAVLNHVVIKGTKFWTTGGVTAYLNLTGQPNMNARVTGASATQITAEILVPAGAVTGKWNLVVKNPDGQFAMKKDAFTVTLRTFKPPRVSSVTPKTVTSGSTVFINGISGSFFNTSAKVAMIGPRGVSIPVSNVTVLSDTKITCDANLTSIAKGYTTVIVTNPDGKKSTRARAFSIK